MRRNGKTANCDRKRVEHRVGKPVGCSEFNPSSFLFLFLSLLVSRNVAVTSSQGKVGDCKSSLGVLQSMKVTLPLSYLLRARCSRPKCVEQTCSDIQIEREDVAFSLQSPFYCWRVTSLSQPLPSFARPRSPPIIQTAISVCPPYAADMAKTITRV